MSCQWILPLGGKTWWWEQVRVFNRIIQIGQDLTRMYKKDPSVCRQVTVYFKETELSSTFSIPPGAHELSTILSGWCSPIQCLFAKEMLPLEIGLMVELSQFYIWESFILRLFAQLLWHVSLHGNFFKQCIVKYVIIAVLRNEARIEESSILLFLQLQTREVTL